MSDLLNKLAAEESAFFGSRFLSPVLSGQPIKVRIAGIVLTLTVNNKRLSGWGVFRPITYKTAQFVRQPAMTERRAYLDLFPAVRLILCRKQGDQWLGIQAFKGDNRFTISGLVPVGLPEEVQLFETILVRYDGMNFWFDSPDRLPRTAEYLRGCLQKLVEPEKIVFPGLTAEERDAYFIAYGPALAADIESRRDLNEERIKDALHKAGAKYKSYIERADSYTVEYTVGRETHRSVIGKGGLEVLSAGICLSGGDRNFDLRSLVGVIAQGQRENHIVRVGGNSGLSEERYEQMYGRGEEDDDY